MSKVKPWKVWAESPPPKPGWYWLAGWYPEDADNYESLEPEEPFIWKLDENDINGKYDPRNIAHYALENFIWYGPLKPPPFNK